MIAIVGVVALVLGATVLIWAGAQLERRHTGSLWGWFVGYLVGVIGTTAGLYLIISSQTVRIGLICAAVVLTVRAALKARPTLD